MSLTISQSPVLNPQPAAKAAKTAEPTPAPQKQASSLGDNLLRSGAGLMIGAQTGALVGGLGVGGYTALTMGANVPAFHKVLGVIGAGGMAAIGGAAAGAVGGAAAGALAQSKGSAAGVYAADKK